MILRIHTRRIDRIMNLKKLTCLYIIMVLPSKIFTEEIGNCFDDNKGTTCQMNQVTIFGEYHQCRVLRRFPSMPTRMTYENGYVFLKVNGENLKYDIETNIIEKTNYTPLGPRKAFRYGDLTFLSGAGKAVVKVIGKNDLELVTMMEPSVDQIDVHDGSGVLFILSHGREMYKKKDNGFLYSMNISDYVHSDGKVVAEKVETGKQLFFILAVSKDHNLLLLVGEDRFGGKLVGISMEKESGYPCENRKVHAHVKCDKYPRVRIDNRKFDKTRKAIQEYYSKNIENLTDKKLGNELEPWRSQSTLSNDRTLRSPSM